MSNIINIHSHESIIDIVSQDIFKKVSFKVLESLPSNEELTKYDLGSILLIKNNDEMLTYFVWKDDNNTPSIFGISGNNNQINGNAINVIELNSIPDNFNKYDSGTLIISKDNKMAIIYEANGVKKMFVFNDNSTRLISYSEISRLYEEV